MSAKTEQAVRTREQAKIRPAPVAPPKKAKKPAPVIEEKVAEIAPDYAESAE